MTTWQKLKITCRVRAFLGGGITAIRTLTTIPIPGRDADSMASSLPWFPIVGAGLGCLVAAIAYLLTHLIVPAWPEATACAAVATGIYLTRGFHLDGLADWADSFGAMTNRQRMFDIMKDSRIGTFGVLALVMILLSQWIALTRLIGHHDFLAIVAAYIISRTSQVGLAATLPYARPEGGTARAFVTEARSVHRWIALLSAAIMLFLLLQWTGVIGLLIGEAIRGSFGGACRRRFGGVTGDLLGACSEIVQTGILVVAAARCG